MKFQTGELIATYAINEMLHNSQEEHDFITNSIRRHISGDWGDLKQQDKEANDDAVINGGHILSAYIQDDVKIWINTTADRTATVIMFPHEY